MSASDVATVERYCALCLKTTSWNDDGEHTMRLVCDECGAGLDAPLTSAQFERAMKRYQGHRIVGGMP